VVHPDGGRREEVRGGVVEERSRVAQRETGKEHAPSVNGEGLCGLLVVEARGGACGVACQWWKTGDAGNRDSRERASDTNTGEGGEERFRGIHRLLALYWGELRECPVGIGFVSNSEFLTIQTSDIRAINSNFEFHGSMTTSKRYLI
jgi:hypothetical protein